MNTTVLYGIVMLAFVLPAVFFFRSGKTQKEKKSEMKEDSPFFPFLKPAAVFLELSGVGSLLKKFFPGKKLQEDITFVKLPLNVPLFYSFSIIFMLFGCLIAMFFLWLIVEEEQRNWIPIAGLFGAWMGFSLPGIKLGNMVQERQKKILRALPFSIDLITSAMRGGLDFSAAIRFYVKKGVPSPLIDEYTQMLREMELGVIRTKALENMAERIKLKAFTDFVAAVIMGMELGSSLSETLEIQGEEMRKARFSLAECKAQKAPSLMLIPMALFIMPAVFIIILTPVFLKMKESGM